MNRISGKTGNKRLPDILQKAKINKIEREEYP
jgi:hypothetical protein